MSVVVSRGTGGDMLVCKGAVEELLKVSSRTEDAGRAVPLDARTRLRVEQLARRLNARGLRVIAVAYRTFGPRDPAYTVEDEKDLVLAGLVGFLGPPKEAAAPALRALRADRVAGEAVTGAGG